jgi:hypothetical protein
MGRRAGLRPDRAVRRRAALPDHHRTRGKAPIAIGTNLPFSGIVHRFPRPPPGRRDRRPFAARWLAADMTDTPSTRMLAGHHPSDPWGLDQLLADAAAETGTTAPTDPASPQAIAVDWVTTTWRDNHATPRQRSPRSPGSVRRIPTSTSAVHRIKRRMERRLGTTRTRPQGARRGRDRPHPQRLALTPWGQHSRRHRPKHLTIHTRSCSRLDARAFLLARGADRGARSTASPASSRPRPAGTGWPPRSCEPGPGEAAAWQNPRKDPDDRGQRSRRDRPHRGDGRGHARAMTGIRGAGRLRRPGQPGTDHGNGYRTTLQTLERT